jgi:hypothetical protein
MAPSIIPVQSLANSPVHGFPDFRHCSWDIHEGKNTLAIPPLLRLVNSLVSNTRLSYAVGEYRRTPKGKRREEKNLEQGRSKMMAMLMRSAVMISTLVMTRRHGSLGLLLPSCQGGWQGVHDLDGPLTWRVKFRPGCHDGFKRKTGRNNPVMTLGANEVVGYTCASWSCC